MVITILSNLETGCFEWDCIDRPYTVLPDTEFVMYRSLRVLSGNDDATIQKSGQVILDTIVI